MKKGSKTTSEKKPIYTSPFKKKKKIKVGKMKVACKDCDSEITKVTESREGMQIKLRGFCESCNTPKVVRIFDIQQIQNSGNKFDFIVKENTPATALPLSTNPANAAPTQATPAAGTTTPAAGTTTPSTTPTAPAVDTAKTMKDLTDSMKKMMDAFQKVSSNPDALKQAADDHAKLVAALTAKPATPATTPVPAQPAAGATQQPVGIVR